MGELWCVWGLWGRSAAHRRTSGKCIAEKFRLCIFAGRSGEASGVFFGGTAARISRAPKFPDAVEPQASNSFGVPGSGRQSFMTSQNPRHQIPLAFLWHLGAQASKILEDASFGRQSFVTLSAFSCQSFLTSRCPSIKVFWHPDPTAPKFLDVFIPGTQVS